MDSNPQAPSVSAPEPAPAPQAPVAPMPPAPPAPQAAPAAPATPVAPSAAPAPAATAVSSNTGMAILAYLGILVIVPFFTDSKNDPFVKFHIKQGLVLMITWIVMGIVGFAIAFAASLPGLIFLGFLGIIIPLLDLGLFIINIIGIINAATGKQKELPVIGHFANGFNF